MAFREEVIDQAERMFREHYATDIVRGQIVGGDHLLCRLYYDGRPQGPRIAVDDDASARAEGRRQLDAIRAECGHAYDLIYRDAGAWELRIWD